MFPYTHQRQRGFTLVEILVVVLILGIASAIIIPQIGSREDLIVAAAARTVMADLTYAQNRAIATQKRHFVAFAGQVYTMTSRDSDVSAMVTVANPVSQSDFTVTFGTAGSGLENAEVVGMGFGTQTTLGFDELGSPFAFDSVANTMTPLTNSGTIQLRSGTVDLTISIEPYTGELTVN